MVNPPTAPPICIDAERRVLGTLLVFFTPTMLASVRAAGVRPDDFYWRQHEAVYRAIIALDAKDGFVDALTVSRFLAGQRHARSGNWFVRVGGEARLAELGAYADANGYMVGARIVAEDGRWRRWLDATHEALEAIYDRDEDAFWTAVGRVREDASGALRVIDGGEAAA